MIYVNEKSTSYLTVTALDAEGVAAQPTSATYDVIDTVSGGKTKDGETLVFTDGSVNITLDKEDATIIDQSCIKEKRIVAIHLIYGDNDELHDEFSFYVRNLANMVEG